MLKAYTSYFVSYLINNMKDISNIDKIILFGSVAKQEATKESDIDVFIELKKENKKIEKEIEKILKEFYTSREGLMFKSKGINNKINLIVGKLEKWKNLKNSIESTGILLYGRYIPHKISKKDIKKYFIIYWDKIEKNRGAFLNKIYGFQIKNKKYKGLIEQFNGKKLGKSNIMIPVEYKEEIIKLIKKYKVHAKIIEVWSDGF